MEPGLTLMSHDVRQLRSRGVKRNTTLYHMPGDVVMIILQHIIAACIDSELWRLSSPEAEAVWGMRFVSRLREVSKDFYVMLLSRWPALCRCFHRLLCKALHVMAPHSCLLFRQMMRYLDVQVPFTHLKDQFITFEARLLQDQVMQRLLALSIFHLSYMEVWSTHLIVHLKSGAVSLCVPSLTGFMQHLDPGFKPSYCDTRPTLTAAITSLLNWSMCTMVGCTSSLDDYFESLRLSNQSAWQKIQACSELQLTLEASGAGLMMERVDRRTWFERTHGRYTSQKVMTRVLRSAAGGPRLEKQVKFPTDQTDVGVTEYVDKSSMIVELVLPFRQLRVRNEHGEVIGKARELLTPVLTRDMISFEATNPEVMIRSLLYGDEDQLTELRERSRIHQVRRCMENYVFRYVSTSLYSWEPPSVGSALENDLPLYLASNEEVLHEGCVMDLRLETLEQFLLEDLGSDNDVAGRYFYADHAGFFWIRGQASKGRGLLEHKFTQQSTV
jgi:hypothetical protein